MPTGYTAGILDGKVTTFKQFATKCMRAFGACIHMRDEPNSKKYTPRVVDPYYLEAIEEAKKKLEEAKTISDKKLMKRIEKSIEENRKWKLALINEKKKNRFKLESIIQEAQSWKPPSNDHIEFKKFMIEQLQVTLSVDCDTEYYEKELVGLEERTPVDIVRVDLIKEAEVDLEHRYEEYWKQVEIVKKANKWVDDVMVTMEYKV